MTPIAYALAIYHEARRRADAQVRAETGVRLCTCGYCRLALYRMTVTVAEEAARRKR